MCEGVCRCMCVCACVCDELCIMSNVLKRGWLIRIMSASVSERKCAQLHGLSHNYISKMVVISTLC